MKSGISDELSIWLFAISMIWFSSVVMNTWCNENDIHHSSWIAWLGWVLVLSCWCACPIDYRFFWRLHLTEIWHWNWVLYYIKREVGDDVIELCDQRLITPQISASFTLDQVNEAVEFFRSGKSVGKVVLNIGWAPVYLWIDCFKLADFFDHLFKSPIKEKHWYDLCKKRVTTKKSRNKVIGLRYASLIYNWKGRNERKRTGLFDLLVFVIPSLSWYNGWFYRFAIVKDS